MWVDLPVRSDQDQSNDSRYAADAIVFENVTINSKGGDVRTYPDPIIE